MEILDLKGALEFSPDRHVYKFLADTPHSSISVVGGVKIPPVDSFIAGYRAGAKKCVPSMKVLIGYSQDFIAQDKCKALALNQIAAGSKVVFNVAGPCGLGALEAAKEQSVWGDGVDVDQSYLGPQVLTSALKRGLADAVARRSRRIHGTATLAVKVPGPGKLSLTGEGVKHQR